MTRSFHLPRRFTLPFPGLAVASLAIASLAGSPVAAQEKPPEETRPDGTVTVEPADAGLFVNLISLEVDGRPRERLPLGTEGVLALEVYNPSEQPATDVVLRFEQLEPGVATDPDRIELGTIASQGSTRTRVTVRVAERDECPDSVIVGGSIRSSQGDAPQKIYLALACPGPHLYQTEALFEGGDGDGIAERGERLQAFVTYRNEGADPATGVRATLTIDSPGVTVVTGDTEWPDIAPGEAARNGAPFIIEVADDAPTQPDCGGMVIDDGSGAIEPDSGGGGSEGSTGTGTVEPEGTTVAFEGKLHVTTAETTFEDYLGNMIVCALSDGTGPPLGAPEPGAPEAPAGIDDSEAGRDLLATGASKDASGLARSPALALAGMLGALALASLVMARKAAATR